MKDSYFLSPPDNNGSTGCTGKVNAAKCSVLYELMKKAIKHYKMYESKIEKDSYTCKRKTENIRAEIRCAACDEGDSQWFDLPNKQVIVSKSTINKFVHACYDYHLARSHLVFGVYYAILNYATQLKPSIDLDHAVLYKIFPARIKKCSTWVTFSNAQKNSDMTAGRECLMYAYEKMNRLLINPTLVRMGYHEWNFFFKVTGV